jgi:tRNA-2-methylthio-N6-dimethylallyladenosine synthase
LKKVFIKTFGCQMNKLDTEVMMGVLAKEGYASARTRQEADVLLFNTCSVRGHSEEKVWSELGKARLLKQDHPDKLVGITGCMAQNVKELFFKRAPQVDFVVGTAEEHRIGEIISRVQQGAKRLLAVRMDRAQPDPSVFKTSRRESELKAWVRIMTGCDQMCAYCVVPFTRGRERSRPAVDILDEIKQLQTQGYQEITLLGQNVNAYGSDLSDDSSFAELLHQIDQRTSIPRVRFLTSHPNNATPELAHVMSQASSVCEHLHLPVQSGANRILEKMNRGYDVERYRRLVQAFREEVPGISLTTDIIVGFPTETEAEFQKTLDLMREIEFDSAYLFKYSPRKGTSAHRMTDDVPESVKKRRHRMTSEVQKEISLKRNRLRVGETLEVFVEHPKSKDPTTWVGRSRDYRKVLFRKPGSYRGRFVTVKVRQAHEEHLFGDLI